MKKKISIFLCFTLILSFVSVNANDLIPESIIEENYNEDNKEVLLDDIEEIKNIDDIVNSEINNIQNKESSENIEEKILQGPVTLIDVMQYKDTITYITHEEIWMDVGTEVRGSDYGTEPGNSFFYNNYRYVSDSIATVEYEGTIIYRYFEYCLVTNDFNLIWDDDGNENERPSTYEIILMQNGKQIANQKLESNETYYNFGEYPEFDSNQEKYEYKIYINLNNKYITSLVNSNTIKATYKIKQYGKYQVISEYYSKDIDDTLILEGSISEEFEAEINKKIGITSIKINPFYNGNEYPKYISGDSIIVEADKENTIIIKYIRDADRKDFKIIHNYYLKNNNGENILESSFEELKEFAVGKIVPVEELAKNSSNNLTYTCNAKENIIIGEDQEIIIEYIRSRNPIQTEINGRIITDNYDYNENEFSFILNNDTIVKNKLDGSFSFPIQLKEPGFYEFEVKMIDTEKDIIEDNSIFKIMFTVKEINGELISEYAINKDNETVSEVIFNIYKKTYGSYLLNHEYYTKDKDGKLTLNKTITEESILLENGTILDTSSLEQKPETDYIFFEISDKSITIESDIQKIITIKYVKDKEYGSYVVKHNYYVKDNNGNFILEDTILEDSVLVEPDTTIGLKEANIIINQKLKEGYKFKDASNNMLIKANKQSEFSINYFREESAILKYGSYQVIHQYYLDDKLESTVTENTVSKIKVGTSIGVVDTDILISKILNHNNKTYDFSSANKVVIEENKTGVLVIKYIRHSDNPTITDNETPKNTETQQEPEKYNQSQEYETIVNNNNNNNSNIKKPINNNLVEIPDEAVPQVATPLLSNPVQTGDNSEIFIYLVLFIVSGFSLFMLKKNKD